MPSSRRDDTPRVWLVHPVRGLDLSDAARYGELCYVVAGGGYLYADEVDNQLPPSDLTKAMNKASLEFDPDKDHLLVAGDHAQLVMFAALLAVRYGYFTQLRYDRHLHAYFPIFVTTRQ
jgi:hypothetical protein